MDSFLFRLATGYHYSPKAKKGYLLAIRLGNEIPIKDNAEGRAIAANMQAQGWEIYDSIGKIEGAIQ